MHPVWRGGCCAIRMARQESSVREVRKQQRLLCAYHEMLWSWCMAGQKSVCEGYEAACTAALQNCGCCWAAHGRCYCRGRACELQSALRRSSDRSGRLQRQYNDDFEPCKALLKNQGACRYNTLNNINPAKPAMYSPFQKVHGTVPAAPVVEQGACRGNAIITLQSCQTSHVFSFPTSPWHSLCCTSERYGRL